MGPDWRQPASDVSYLLDVILQHIPPPSSTPGHLQMQISSIDYSSYQGRIAVGRIMRGSIKAGMQVSVMRRDGIILQSQVKEVYLFEGLGKEKIKTAVPSGEIVAVLGPEDFDIGDTLTDPENNEALPRIHVDEPTMSMLFTINTSPFFGREGIYVTSRHLRERLLRETEKNLALRVEETGSPEKMQVYGRGILHLSILVETMRREGYEFQLGQPKVLVKEYEGERFEPVEILTVHVPENFTGKVIELVSRRKGELLEMGSRGDRVAMVFEIPSRGLIGLSGAVLTATEGEAVMAHQFKDFEPWKGDIHSRRNGALVAMETGVTAAYALDKLQDRGKFFIHPAEEVYAGQVVGEHTRSGDIVVNVIKTKKLTNMRASSADDKIILPPPVKHSLEEAMEYIADDEYLEVTPRSVRIRKIILDEQKRKVEKKKKEEVE